MANYFRNTELAARYNISEGTVRNWIKSVKQGKLHLELTERRSRTYVTNSIGNIALMENLVEQNRKYRNSLSAKSTTPKRDLYEVFSAEDIVDIIRNLELHHEVPRQYGYFGVGAQEWDEYINKQLAVTTPSVIKREMELLEANYSYIDSRLAKFGQVNVIDVGPGNAAPARVVIEHLMAQGKFGRYIAVDASREMLRVAERNLRSWFGAEFNFEGHLIDITKGQFAWLTAKDYLKSKERTMNLVLFLGATPTNFRLPADAFRALCESMYPDDLMVYSDKVEMSEEPPEWFKHSYSNKPKAPELLVRHRYVLDLLGIDESFYDAEVGFDQEKRQKYARAELKFALNLKIKLGDAERSLQFEKGDKITVWRSWRMTHRGLIDLQERSGFYVTHSSQTSDRYILTISEPRRD